MYGSLICAWEIRIIGFLANYCESILSVPHCTMPPTPSTTYAPSEAASVGDDYDLVENPRSLESSLADLDSTSRSSASHLKEIPPVPSAKLLFDTASLSPEDIQANVQRSIQTTVGREKERSGSRDSQSKAVRVYVDGVFDVLNVG